MKIKAENLFQIGWNVSYHFIYQNTYNLFWKKKKYFAFNYFASHKIEMIYQIQLKYKYIFQ